MNRANITFQKLSKLRHLLEWPIRQSFLVGLVARLLVMPFAAHSDLLHAYWDAHLISYHRQLGSQLQNLLRYFHSGCLWLLAPALPDPDTLWIHQAERPFLNPFLSSQVISTQGWFDFINHPQVYRTLFLLKIPYLFFDLACVSLLYCLGSNKAKSAWLFKFWWLNPILLFAVYVFGRHEVIALFFVLLSLYLIKRKQEKWGLLALGMAIAIRYHALFILPFFVLSLQSTWKKHWRRLILGLAPWLIVNLVAWTLIGSTEVKSLVNVSHDNYLLSMKFQVAAWDNLYVFPLLYFLLVLHRLYNREYGLRSLQHYSLITLLVLFATSYTGQSPQYWTWFLPLLALRLAEDRRLLSLHVAQILCLAIYSFIGSRSTAGYLFASIAPDLFWSLPSPVEVMSHFASPEIVIGLARTAFSAVTLWMIYISFRRMPVSFGVNRALNEGV